MFYASRSRSIRHQLGLYLFSLLCSSMKSCCLSHVNMSSSHELVHFMFSLLLNLKLSVSIRCHRSWNRCRSHRDVWSHLKEKKKDRAQINPLQQVQGDGQVNRASGCHTSLYFCQTPTESQRCKVITVCCESVTPREDGNILCEKWNFILYSLSRNMSHSSHKLKYVKIPLSFKNQLKMNLREIIRLKTTFFRFYFQDTTRNECLHVNFPEQSNV